MGQPEETAVQIIDRTGQTATVTHTLDKRYIMSGGNPSARRTTSAISGIMLHQTSFMTRSIDRMNSVIANYGVMPDGRVLFLRALDLALNSVGTDQHAIDIEMVGNYPGAQDIRQARRRHEEVPHPPLVQIGAGRALVKHLQSQHGLTRIMTHVQWRAKNCCGPHFWYNVGDWAIRNLGMTTPTTPRSRFIRAWGRADYAVERPLEPMAESVQ
jgi:hypothetical protein